MTWQILSPLNKVALIILIVFVVSSKSVDGFRPLDSEKKSTRARSAALGATFPGISTDVSRKYHLERNSTIERSGTTASGKIIFPSEQDDSRKNMTIPKFKTHIGMRDSKTLASSTERSYVRPNSSLPLTKFYKNDTEVAPDSESRRRRRKKPGRNRTVLESLRDSASETFGSLFGGNGFVSLLEYDPGAPHLPDSASATPHKKRPHGFQNSRISAMIPPERREFPANGGPPQLPLLDGIGREHHYYGGSGPFAGTGPAFSAGPGAGHSFTNHHSSLGHPPGYGPDYSYDYPVYEALVEDYHPPHANGGYDGPEIVTVTHTQFKNVPVTQYITDTRTDFITHYKTHFRTKVREVPVTAYSTQLIPRDVPIYTTIYNTKYHTEFHTLTTNYHHTMHYTHTVHKTKVLTNYITETQHQTYTSLLHTTLYEPVYLTTTYFSSQYITTTDIQNHYITTTSYTPVYVTTTSVERFYDTETVVTPHYVTTTFFKEIFKTITHSVYVTTTEHVYNKVPLYYKDSHIDRHEAKTSGPYIVTATSAHHRNDDSRSDLQQVQSLGQKVTPGVLIVSSN
ncbi:hypothetical protein FHG87_005973 [Trinorchestia longiramus]|nr:hypothetical protein FHG87_005973 [Trinorchestia longiramus]